MENMRSEGLKVANIISAAIFILFCGLAFLGKNFAYINLGPIYITELILFLGIIGFLITAQSKLFFLFSFSWIVSVFLLINFFIAIFNITEYGMDSLRDSAIWYYSLFCPVTFALLLRNGNIDRLFRSLDRVCKIFCFTALPLWWISNNMEIFRFGIKSGDTMVFLGICFGWLIARNEKIMNLRSIMVFVSVLAIGITNRGGLISFVIIIIPTLPAIWRKHSGIFLTGSIFLLLIFGYATNAALTLNNGKEISVSALSELFVSIVGSSENSRLENTKEWRINWWSDIYKDSLDYKNNSIFGRGYGINLADFYGYQVNADGSLRSPHSAWMTFLARTGIPGLGIYILLLLIWFKTMLRFYSSAKPETKKILLWCIFAVFGIIFNSSVDVYIEGPVGGFLLWCMIGIGLAIGKTYTRVCYRGEGR